MIQITRVPPSARIPMVRMERISAALRSASVKLRKGLSFSVGAAIILLVLAFFPLLFAFSGGEGHAHSFQHSGDHAEDDADDGDPALMQPAVEKRSEEP